MGHRRDEFIGGAIVLSIMCAACATDMGDKQAGQPCTRSGQCAPGLVCSGGACLDVSHADDAGKDAGSAEVAGKDGK